SLHRITTVHRDSWHLYCHSRSCLSGGRGNDGHKQQDRLCMDWQWLLGADSVAGSDCSDHHCGERVCSTSDDPGGPCVCGWGECAGCPFDWYTRSLGIDLCLRGQWSSFWLGRGYECKPPL